MGIEQSTEAGYMSGGAATAEPSAGPSAYLQPPNTANAVAMARGTSKVRAPATAEGQLFAPPMPSHSGGTAADTAMPSALAPNALLGAVPAAPFELPPPSALPQALAARGLSLRQINLTLALRDSGVPPTHDNKATGNGASCCGHGSGTGQALPAASTRSANSSHNSAIPGVTLDPGALPMRVQGHPTWLQQQQQHKQQHGSKFSLSSLWAAAGLPVADAPAGPEAHPGGGVWGAWAVPPPAPVASVGPPPQSPLLGAGPGGRELQLGCVRQVPGEGAAAGTMRVEWDVPLPLHHTDLHHSQPGARISGSGSGSATGGGGGGVAAAALRRLLQRRGIPAARGGWAAAVQLLSPPFALPTGGTAALDLCYPRQSNWRLSLGLSDTDPGRVSLYLLYDDDDDAPYGKAQQQGRAAYHLGPAAAGSDCMGGGGAGQQQQQQGLPLSDGPTTHVEGEEGSGGDGAEGWWLTWRVEACGVERGGGAGVRIPVPGDLCHLFTTRRHQQRQAGDQGRSLQASNPAPRRHGWGIRSVFSEEQLDSLLPSTITTSSTSSDRNINPLAAAAAAPTTRGGSYSGSGSVGGGAGVCGGGGGSCVVLRVVATVQHLPLRGVDVLGCPSSGGAPLLLSCTPAPLGLGPRTEGGGNSGAVAGAQAGGVGPAASAGAAGAGVPSAPEERRGGGGPMGDAVAAAAAAPHAVVRPFAGRGGAAPGPYMPLPLLRPAMRPVSQLDVLLVSLSPRAVLVEGLLPPQLCDALRGVAEPRLIRSRVSTGTETPSRVSQSTFFTGESCRLPPVLAAEARITQLMERPELAAGAPPSLLKSEALQVVSYDRGGFYSDHYDNKAGGNVTRAATIIVYLADTPQGGATFFPRSTGVPDLQALGLLGPRPAALSDQQGGSTVSGSRDANTHAPRAVRFDAHNGGGNGGDNGGGGGSGGGPAVLSAVPRLTQLLHGLPVARPGLRVHPAKGRALVFWSRLPDGTEDLSSLHSAEPVRCGDKWITTRWFREMPQQPSDA